MRWAGLAAGAALGMGWAVWALVRGSPFHGWAEPLGLAVVGFGLLAAAGLLAGRRASAARARSAADAAQSRPAARRATAGT